jgi:uncharacterized alkaline shock family protein YloU
MEQNEFNEHPGEYRDVGNLKISEEVISTIAGAATEEIKGVSGLALRQPVTERRLLGAVSKKAPGKSIHLEMREGEAVLDIYVNLYLGAKIPDTASQIQTRVKDAVQNMTGITVSKVNVHITGIVIAHEEDSETL